MNGFQKMNRAAEATRGHATKSTRSTLAVKRQWGQLLVDIAANERALLYRNRRLVEVLTPGRHRFIDAFNALGVTVHDITTGEFTDAALSSLLRTHAAEFDAHIASTRVGANQVALVYRAGVLARILPAGSLVAYWIDAAEFEVQLVDVALKRRVDDELASQLANSAIDGATDAVLSTEIAENHVGLLFINGRFVEQLPSGRHAFWRHQCNIAVQHVDQRLQGLDVQGQEILTKDKVSLRVNLSATFSIVDAVKAARSVHSVRDYLYREFQLGLREAVGTRRLDDLLSNKDEINDIVAAFMSDKALDVGVALEHIGIKDIILPGEMKTILNQVVEAEKAAQANVIKRREETAATRSLLNTAKVIEDNPVLMRLKELESLEKVVEKVGALNVYSGLNGIMDDLVRIKQS